MRDWLTYEWLCVRGALARCSEHLLSEGIVVTATIIAAAFLGGWRVALYSGLLTIIVIFAIHLGLEPSKLSRAGISRRARPNARVLRSISERLRSLPAERDISHNNQLIDTTTIAGRLLLRAMEHGAFISEEYIDFVEVVQMSEAGEFVYQRNQDRPLPPAWHVFVNARRWILRQQDRAHDEYGRVDVEEGCPMFADLIDEQIHPKGEATSSLFSTVLAVKRSVGASLKMTGLARLLGRNPNSSE